MIYLDNAATTAMSAAALNEYVRVATECYGNPSGNYTVGRNAKDVLDNARQEIASVINAGPKEVIFTSGGSESDNQAIISAAWIGLKNNKKHIISTTFEHHAVLHTLSRLRKEGFDITLLDVPSNGVIDPSEVDKAIREDTCLVTIMFVNNEIGTIQPVRQIGEICRRHNVLFHTDAVQAIGHIDIDVKELGIDLLSASAHKFHGPKGVGFLYARKGIRLSNLVEGGAQEFGKRAGTENVAGIASMAVALRDTLADHLLNKDSLEAKRDRLIHGLLEIPNAVLNGDPKQRTPGNVNVSFDSADGRSLLDLLDREGIQASSGSACTSGNTDPSHVLMAIGRSADLARGALRLTFENDLTEEQIDHVIDVIRRSVSVSRG